jgi:diguanylate cyclase (GGDEF)-like protein
VIAAARRHARRRVEARGRLSALVDHFLHPSLTRDADQLYRARVLIMVILTFGALIAGACGIVALSGLPLPNKLLGLGLLVPALAGTAYLLTHLRRHGSYALCSNAAVALVTVLVVGGILLSGGIARSSVTPLLSVPPLMAYFMGGVRGGNRSAACVLAVVLSLIGLECLHIHPPQTVATVHDRRLIQLLATFMAVATVSTMAVIFELTAMRLRRQRDREHRKALALAQIDPLTRLANRRSLEDHLDRRIARYWTATPHARFVLGCADLDGFKPINDQHGHKVGDEVLIAVAARLRQVFHGDAVVGRSGGDEFTVILDAADGDAAAVQSRAERALALVAEPIATSVGPVRVAMSLGLAVFPTHGGNGNQLKRAADQAMYRSKQAGGSAWCWGESWAVERPESAAATGGATHAGVAPAAAPGAGQPADTPRTGPRFDPLRLVDWFLHPNLRRSSDMQVRARILVMTLLFGTMVDMVTSIVLAVVPLETHSKIAGVAICLSMGIITMTLLTVLRRQGSYRACGTAMVANAFVGVLVGVFVSGGPAEAAASQLLPIAPLVACFFGGVRRGAMLGIATLSIVALAAIPEPLGLHFYNAVAPSDAAVTRVLVGAVGLVFIIGMAFIYEFIARSLKCERDREQRLVEHLAQTDALTGLANRAHFDVELETRIRGHEGVTARDFALCCIDLDDFKPINDRYGHEIGDEVLRAVAQRLRQCLRDTDYVGRHGGDEFMLLFAAEKGELAVETLALRVREAIMQPIATRAGTVSVSASLGFSLFPRHGGSADALKVAADRAMYVAKQGGAGWSLYSETVARQRAQ